MEYLIIILAIFSALFHIAAFVMESILFKKGAHKNFKIEEKDAEAVFPFAFNQGFYNLFLAILMLLGLGMYLNEHALGKGVLFSSSFVMTGAGIVLAYTDKELARVAVIQGLPPAVLIYLVFSYS